MSRNSNQIAKRANATGTVYRQDIEDIKKAVDEIWRLDVYKRQILDQKTTNGNWNGILL